VDPTHVGAVGRDVAARTFLIQPYLFFSELRIRRQNDGRSDPHGGFQQVSNGPSSSGVRPGDGALQAQYRLTKFHAGSGIPTTSVAVQETLLTGKYAITPAVAINFVH
jgi:hypothetical protein